MAGNVPLSLRTGQWYSKASSGRQNVEFNGPCPKASPWDGLSIVLADVDGPFVDS